MPDSLNVPLDSTAAQRGSRGVGSGFPSMLGTSIATRGMSAGNATEWGLGGAVPQSTLPPISLGGGIPDAETQPRAETAGRDGPGGWSSPAMRRWSMAGAQGFEPAARRDGRVLRSQPPGPSGRRLVPADERGGGGDRSDLRLVP